MPVYQRIAEPSWLCYSGRNPALGGATLYPLNPFNPFSRQRRDQDESVDRFLRRSADGGRLCPYTYHGSTTLTADLQLPFSS
jgi:hypothetical protein